MRKLFMLLFTILTIQQLFAQECNEGYKNLFNGQNLDGWYIKIKSGNEVLGKEVFQVENGIIHVFKDFPDSAGMKDNNCDTHGLIYTNNKYSKFIFKFEYKWCKKIFNNFHKFQYDAGCYYHVYNDKIWPFGIEYQVRYDHTKKRNHTGDYWASNTQFQWYSLDSVTFKLPSEGGLKMPIKSGEHRASLDADYNALNDEWNTCEVIVMGNEYSIHKLNGKIVNMATNLSVGDGVIGLQSETAEIFYRNIMIKEFDKNVPLEEFLK